MTSWLEDENEYEVLISDEKTNEIEEILKDLVKEENINFDKAKDSNERYLEIQDSLKNILKNENSLLQQERELLKQKERQNLVNNHIYDDNDENEIVNYLKEKLIEAESEVLLIEEKNNLLNNQINELKDNKNEILNEINKHNEERRPMLLSLIEEISDEVLELEQNLLVDHERSQTSSNDIIQLNNILKNYENEILELKQTIEIEESNLSTNASIPEKIRKENDLLDNKLKSFKKESDRIDNELTKIQNQINSSKSKERDYQLEHVQSVALLEQGQVAIEARLQAIDDIQRDLDLVHVKHQQQLAERVQLDIELKSKQTSFRRENSKFKRVINERDVSIFKLKEGEKLLEEIKNQIPSLDITKEKLINGKINILNEIEKNKEEYIKLEKEEDICLHQLLKEEDIGKEKARILELSKKHINILEEEIQNYIMVEMNRSRLIVSHVSKRDLAMRNITRYSNNYKEKKEHLRILELISEDLQSHTTEKFEKLKEAGQLYDLVKNQRNKCVTLVQTSRQAIAEMKDKLNVLECEIDVQKNKMNQKISLLNEEKNRTHESIKERDIMDRDIKKLKGKINELKIEDKRLNAEKEGLELLINTLNKDISSIKTNYNNIIKNRNITGKILIDRNDEICILYDKSKLQEQVFRHGEMELQRKEEEIRLTKIEMNDLDNSIRIIREKIKEIPELDKEMAKVKRDILVTKRESEQLSLSLEDPNNVQRWRNLKGSEPDFEHLEAKRRQLEDRINNKENVLIEKDIILKELNKINAKMQKQITDTKDNTLLLANSIIQFQNKMQDLSNKLKSISSELSIYQDLNQNLSDEKRSIELILQMAKKRMEEGKAPTNEIQKRWEQMERHDAIIKRIIQEKKEIEYLIDNQNNISFAEKRPNAYISEDLGIPKPFLFHPFKPMEVGSTMRFFKT